MGKNKHGMLDHGKDKVKRIQLYTRMYKTEEDLLNKHIKYIKGKKYKTRDGEEISLNKSEWLRKVILDALIKERKAIKESSKS